MNKSEAVENHKPEYIITKTQKIYFFSDPTLNIAKSLQATDNSYKDAKVRLQAELTFMCCI